MIMINIENKKIVKVMHQNCITSKAYEKISDIGKAMDMIYDSGNYEELENTWRENHEDLADSYGFLPQEAINKMSDECATEALNEFINKGSFDCGDFTLYIIDEDADMYDIAR